MTVSNSDDSMLMILTRLGFGLNIAPSVIIAVVTVILVQVSDIEHAMLPYVNDIIVNEELVSVEGVGTHFSLYGLECKQPNRARLLGLRVQSSIGKLWTCEKSG